MCLNREAHFSLKLQVQDSGGPGPFSELGSGDLLWRPIHRPRNVGHQCRTPIPAQDRSESLRKPKPTTSICTAVPGTQCALAKYSVLKSSAILMELCSVRQSHLTLSL